MSFDLAEWLNLALRWLHLVAGIAWIGGSFHFIGLDMRLRKPAPDKVQEGVTGEDWAVHGGGFYHSQKYQVAPSNMPSELHWTKWESYVTWISGFALLVLVYYIGAQTYLIDPAKAKLRESDAIALGLSALVAGWFFYDTICRSPLGRSNRLVGLIWFAFLVLAAIFLNSLFNARAAYMHIGAMIGTSMVANVFFVIIPNQRKVVAALVAGREPDPALGAAAKQRSLHNNYMTLPVLFIMISHHYPMTYGAQRPWIVLSLLGLTGVAVRHVFNLRHRDAKTGTTMAVAVVLALASMTYVSMEKAWSAKAETSIAELASASPAVKPATAAMTYSDIEPVLAKHCSGCHSQRPTNPAFTAPPLGAVLDSYAHVRALAPRIKAVTVDSEVMPLGNSTGMTRTERQMLADWIERGTPQ